jgi:DNA-binding MarR family transcriptional regulator
LAATEGLFVSAEFAGRVLGCNCGAVRQAARALTQVYDQHLAASGLRITQFSILARLERRPMTIGELAAELVMDRTTLGRNIGPLERDGLIRVKPGAEDRRRKELHLTRSGERRLAAALPAWKKAQRDFEARFGAARSAELRQLLQDVVRGGPEPGAARPRG